MAGKATKKTTKKNEKVEEKPKEEAFTADPAHIRKLNSTVWLTRELKVGKEVVLSEESEEAIAAHVFVTEPAKVRISKGMTIKMAKFQFARFDCEVNLPCYAEEVPEVYGMVDKFVEEKLMVEVEAAKKYFDKLDSKDE